MSIAPTVVRYLRVLLVYGGLLMSLAACSNAAREASAKPGDGVPQPTTQTPPSLKSITLTPAAPTLPKGLTQTFIATGNYSDGSTRDFTAGATWNASENTVATISNTGLATATGLGTAKISAMVSGVTGEATLTVAAAALIEISVTPPTLVMDKGSIQRFTATGKYTDDSTLDITAQASWASSLTSVATISSDGQATAVSKGTSTVSARIGEITGSTTLTVTDAVLKIISITSNAPSLAKGLALQFTATGIYSDATTQDLTTTAVWSSQSTAVATVSAGLVKAVGIGAATITATVNGIVGNTTINITAAVLQSITVTPSWPSIAMGLTQQFTATGNYSDGSTRDLTANVVWAQIGAVASIGTGGLAVSAGLGTGTIRATLDGFTGSTPLTVIPAVLKSISVTPSAPSLAKGLTLQFTATGTYTDATTQNLTSSAIWTSLTTTVATISAGGFATAVDLGTTTIRAVVGGITGSTILTVMNSFTIGGTVSGLAAGASIVLQNNLADDLTVSGNGAFTFNTPVADGAGYDVTVKTQPAPAGQHCNVLSGAGTVPGVNVAGIIVNCGAAQYPRFSYMTNFDDNTISIYTVNASTGQLRANGYVMASGINPTSVTVDPSGQFAYVANQGSGNVSAYAINTRTGALASIGPNLVAGANPRQVVVDPSGKFTYVVNGTSADVSAYAIDANTGALTTIACGNGVTCYGANFRAGNPGVSSAVSIAVDPSSKFAYVANNGLGEVLAYTINTTTGALTPIDANPNTVGVIENFKAGSSPRFVTVDPSGKFVYAANYDSIDISAYVININTGYLTQIDCSAGGGGAACNGANFKAGARTNTSANIFITFNPSGKFAYVANSVSNDVAAFTINASSGALTRIGLPVVAGSSPYSVTVDPSGKFAYVANYISKNVLTYRIDATTGALTPAGDMRARFGSTSFAVTKGPAPVTYTPNFAYVANFGPATTISTYPITANGSLTAVDTTEAAAVASPNSIAIDPSGKFAYAANNWLFNSIYSISTYTLAAGVLTNTGAVNAVDQSMSPWDVVVDPSGRFVYVSSGDGIFRGNVAAYAINADTGGLTLVGATATGTKPMSIDIDPTGRFIYAANYFSGDVSAYSIDATTGALTTIIANAAGNVTNFPAGNNPSAVTVDPSGKFAYVTNSYSHDVWSYSIDATTGALTKLGAYAVAPSSNPDAIAVDPSGRFAYVVNNTSHDLLAFDINPATAALSNRRPYSLGAGAFPGSVTVDASGKYVYVTNYGSDLVSAFSIDATTGSLTANGTVYKVGSGPKSITTTATIQ